MKYSAHARLTPIRIKTAAIRTVMIFMLKNRLLACVNHLRCNAHCDRARFLEAGSHAPESGASEASVAVSECCADTGDGRAAAAARRGVPSGARARALDAGVYGLSG